MLQIKYQDTRPYGFRQDVLCFSLYKACDPWGLAIFGPHGLIEQTW